MKEVSVDWFRDKKEYLSKIHYDIKEIGIQLNYRDKKPFIIKNVKYKTVISSSRKRIEKEKFFEIKSPFTLECLMNLLQKEEDDTKELMEKVVDDDFCCENCKCATTENSHYRKCQRSYCSSQNCKSYYNDGKITLFDFTEEAKNKILGRSDI